MQIAIKVSMLLDILNMKENFMITVKTIESVDFDKLFLFLFRLLSTFIRTERCWLWLWFRGINKRKLESIVIFNYTGAMTIRLVLNILSFTNIIIACLLFFSALSLSLFIHILTELIFVSLYGVVLLVLYQQ